MSQTVSQTQPIVIQSASQSGADEIDIRSLLMLLWRRRFVIVGCVLAGFSLALIALGFIKPQYRAQALVLVESENPQTSGLARLQGLTGGVGLDSATVMNELEILRSRTMARQVIERLELMADPEFNRQLEDDGKTTELSKKNHGFKPLTVHNQAFKTLPPEVVDQSLAKVVGRFHDQMSVRSIPGSFAIQIEFTSSSPAKAALVSNTIADVYIRQRMNDSLESSGRIKQWLEKRLNELQARTRSAESELVAYKTQHNLMEGMRPVTSSAEQLSHLNSQLINAKVQKTQSEAKLAQIENNMAVEGGIQSLPDVLGSDIVRRLKLSAVELEGELAELSNRYGQKHPDIIKLKSELKDLRRSIRGEMVKIRQATENELAIAMEYVDSLELQLTELKSQRTLDEGAMIQLRELMQEAEAARLMYNTFLQSYEQTNEREGLQQAKARVISYAIVPDRPYSPNRMLLLSLSLFASLFGGVFIALLMEKLDHNFKSTGQLEEAAGFPCFGLIPLAPDLGKPDLVRYVLSEPASGVAEAVRTLRTTLNLRPPKTGQPKVLTVTSSFPAEGKTTLSLWLGRMAAKSGEKVIIIDADLRRPNVHKSLGEDNALTLVEYLSGKKALKDIIHKDPLSGAHMIYARSVPGKALDLVNSAKMHKLVESLRQVYDLVVLDTPACLAVPDARVLAKMSDQLLYAVSWNETPRDAVLGGVKQFSDMGCESLAFVLTNVDVKKQVRYGYGDAVYNYDRYKEKIAAE